MPTDMSADYTAFYKKDFLLKGTMMDVLVRIARNIPDDERQDVLIFDGWSHTGKPLDIDLRGNRDLLLHRAQMHYHVTHVAKGPGRPKLGVTSREVSLLPRHWEWLETQQGGASAVLRKLVEEASKTFTDRDSLRQAQERTYNFLTVMAGDMPGYENVLRALYKDDQAEVARLMAEWPPAVSAYALQLMDKTLPPLR